MTRDTEDVVALVEGARRAAAIGRSSCNITAQKFGNHLNALANTIQFLSDRIDVLEGENGRLLAAISWIEPPFVDRNTDVAELRKRVQFCVTDASRARTQNTPDSKKDG